MLLPLARVEQKIHNSSLYLIKTNLSYLALTYMSSVRNNSCNRFNHLLHERLNTFRMLPAVGFISGHTDSQLQQNNILQQYRQYIIQYIAQQMLYTRYSRYLNPLCSIQYRAEPKQIWDMKFTLKSKASMFTCIRLAETSLAESDWFFQSIRNNKTW